MEIEIAVADTRVPELLNEGIHVMTVPCVDIERDRAITAIILRPTAIVRLDIELDGMKVCWKNRSWGRSCKAC